MAADVNSAIDYVLHWEDANLSGVVTSDGGGKTRFGLAQKWNADLTDENFFTLPANKALSVARNVYAAKYATRVRAQDIVDDCVRAKILDMYVNAGVNGVKLVQRACGVNDDGAFGSQTLTQVNSANAPSLLTKLARLSLSFYDAIQGTESEHASWARRARCLGKIGDDLSLK